MGAVASLLLVGVLASGSSGESSPCSSPVMPSAPSSRSILLRAGGSSLSPSLLCDAEAGGDGARGEADGLLVAVVVRSCVLL